jgi:hypothetical protein
MTQQTAMVRRLVRLVLRRRGVGLGRHRRAEDKEDDPGLANGLRPRNHAGQKHIADCADLIRLHGRPANRAMSVSVR